MSSLSHVGVRGVDHMGFTVPDLDQAIDFFTLVLGADHLFSHGPYPASPDSPQQFGRPADSSVTGIAMVRLGSTNIELLAFHSPQASQRRPRPDEAGGHHLAIYVDDLNGALAAVRANRLEVLGSPMDLPGPERGIDARFAFFRAPWGLIVELVSYPSGKVFLQEHPGRLHDPRRGPSLRGSQRRTTDG